MLACCVICFCCLFICLLVCLFVCVVITLLLLLRNLFLFLCICTYLRSYRLESCTIIFRLFNIFLETDVFVCNVVPLINFGLFVHLLVHTCIIMHMFIHFVVQIICNICLLFALFFVCLHVDHDFTNASFYLCLFLYIYAPVYVANVDIFTIYFYYIYNSISL